MSNINKNKSNKNNSKKTKHYKIRYKRVLIIFLTFLILLIAFFILLNLHIKNIYIYNNTILKDQEIIEFLGIEDYPSILKFTTYSLEKTLNKNIYVKNSNISRVGLRGLSIKVEENLPLFYDKSKNKLILTDGSEVVNDTLAPTLINYTPDKKLESLKSGLSTVDRDILLRISEIEYSPNEVDDDRFLLRMNDGNYVYITLLKIESLNKYIEIIKNFSDKTGILYLDSGEYFKVLEVSF